MRISKTLAALVAASSLGGGALALVAPGAAFAVAPPVGDTSLAGTALVNGTAVADVEVDVYQVSPTGAADYLGSTDTEADGTYYFDFDTNDTNSGDSVDTPDPGTSLKLAFFDARTLTGDQLRARDQFYLGKTTLAQGNTIAQPAAGTTFTATTVSLSLQAGIKGTVTVPVPAGYIYQGFAEAYDADDQYVEDADFDNDPATTGQGHETTYLLNRLDPNQSYTVRFYAYAYSPTDAGPPISYVSQFYKSGSTFANATPVAVGAPGAITQPVDMTLTNALTAATAPSIVGQVAPGKTLSVDPGTWSVKTNNTYTYQWLLNGAVVSTSPTYTVAKANVGKKLQVVVTNRVDDYLGSATTPAEKVKYAAKLKAKAKAVYVDGKRVVQIKGHLKLQGVKKKKVAKALKGVKVTVYEVSKTDDTVMVKVGKARVKKGELLVTVKGLTAGKHYLEIDLSGKKVADVVKVVKAKV